VSISYKADSPPESFSVISFPPNLIRAELSPSDVFNGVTTSTVCPTNLSEILIKSNMKIPFMKKHLEFGTN
jgi:hypothetical protein